jgi:2-methylcitrate dehydratase PrpD
MTVGATAALASYVVAARLEDFPDSRIELARLAVLDTVAVGVAGSRDPSGRVIANYVRRLGGVAEATVWGTDVRGPAPLVALATGTMAHALDYDDMHTGAAGHPSAVLVPAALAVAETVHAEGRSLIEAYLVAFEVVYRLGSEAGMAALADGFHPTGLWAPVGAAVAASRLLGLGESETVMAMGIAGSQAAGLRANFGTMTKPLHAGQGAMAGITAALLARDGFTASDQIVEDDRGFLAVFGDETIDLERVVEGLGSDFFPDHGYGIKLYPSCGKTHSAIDAALYLRQTHNFSIEDIAAVQVEAVPATTEVLVYHSPSTALEAKFSLEYCVAVALYDGVAGLAQFTEERMAEPGLSALLGRVEIVHPDDAGWETFLAPETVSVRLLDGRSYSHRVDRPSGALGAVIGRNEVVRKARECSTGVLAPTSIDHLIDLCADLENVADVCQMAAVLGVSA